MTNEYGGEEVYVRLLVDSFMGQIGEVKKVNIWTYRPRDAEYITDGTPGKALWRNITSRPQFKIVSPLELLAECAD